MSWCTECACDDCTRRMTERNPMYEALMEVLQANDVWEGDAHAVAELVLDLTDWLKHPGAGSASLEKIAAIRGVTL